MDEDDVGVLQTAKVEQFVRAFLRGTQIEGNPNTDFEHEHQETYKLLRDNESGEINGFETSEFMRQLMKNQIICLQKRLEIEKMQRAIDHLDDAQQKDEELKVLNN